MEYVVIIMVTLKTSTVLDAFIYLLNCYRSSSSFISCTLVSENAISRLQSYVGGGGGSHGLLDLD